MANQHRRSPIDNVRWTSFVGTVLALGAGTASVNIFTAQNTRETVLRTRGNLIAWIDGLESPSVGVIVSVGAVLVPEGSGTTARWTPFDDIDAPWFFYEEFVLGYEEYVTDVIDCPGITSFRKEIDVKAMRKIPSDTEIQLVVENTTIAGAGAVNVSVNGRMLLGQR